MSDLSASDAVANGTPSKRQKLDHSTESSDAASSSENGNNVESAEKVDHVFKDLDFVKILKSDPSRKTVFVHGKDRDGKDAVVIIEQPALVPEKIEALFDQPIAGALTFKNDIYHNFNIHLDPAHNAAKVTLIHPAEKSHLQKFDEQVMHLIEESPEDYENITLPCIKAGKRFDTKWVDNILAHEKETDRIVFEDPDDETGFVLLLDLKWEGKNVETLYLIVLTRKHILSIRDLRGEHLPMLRNIKEKTAKAVKEKYGLESSKIRAYFHYQPTFYHLHVHVSSIKYDAPGRNVEKAHMLTTVISNLEMDPDYYKKATMAFIVGEKDPLWSAFAKKYPQQKVDDEQQSQSVSDTNGSV